MNKKRTLAGMVTVIILASIPMNLSAQEEMNIWWEGFHAERENVALIKQRMQTLMDARNENLRTLPISELIEDAQFWWSGQQVYVLGYGETDDIRPFLPFSTHRDPQPLYTLICKNGKNGTTVTVKDHADWKVAMQQVGPWRVLVFRDGTGAVKDCYIGTTWNDVANHKNVQNLSMHDLYDGVYEMKDGTKVVFGPVMEHYKDLDYSSDPGFFYFHTDKYFAVTDTLEYGGERVSRGNPSSPKWGKMPGGGGAGAIMGPMQWRVTPIPMGLKVTVIHDEPFVEHSPRIEGGEAELTWVEGPYEGINGRLPIASVRPLPTEMLRMLPKGDLHIIMNEILDRHADGSKLTAIEELNLGVIRVVLNE